MLISNVSYKKKYIQNLLSLLFLLFIFLLLYDGAIRKWLLPEYEKVTYFAKDFILLVIFGVILFFKRESIRLKGPATVIIPIVLYASYVLIEVFNPRLPNLWVGLLGVKAHLLYAILLIVIPASLHDLKSTFTLIERWLPWVVIPVCMVAFVQVFWPQDSLINSAVRGGIRYVPVSGDIVRANATFSYVTGFSWFQVAASITTIFWFLCKQKFSRPMLLTLFVTSFALPLSGSRATLVIVFAASAIMVLACIYSGLLNKRIFGIGLILGVLIILVSWFLPVNFWGGILERFLTSATISGDSYRYFTNFTNAFNFFEKAGLIGFGSGATHQAAPYLVGSQPPYSWLPSGIESLSFEQESGRLVLELGVVGWGLSLAFRLAALILSVNLILKGKNHEIRSVGILCAPMMAIGVHSGSGFIMPPVGAVFYWSCFALLLIGWKEQCKFNYGNQ